MRKFYSKRLNAIFEAETDVTVDGLLQAMKDLRYDRVEEGITKKDIEAKIREMAFKVFDVTKEEVERNHRAWRLAKKKHLEEWYELIETVQNLDVVDRLGVNPMLKELAEVVDLTEGDQAEFWVQEKTELVATRVSGDHHDISVQHFRKPTKVNVAAQKYAIKIGDDIRQYLLGRKNFTEQVEAVTAAIDTKINREVIKQIATINEKLPASADMSVTLSNIAASSKDEYRTKVIDLIQKVKGTNDGSDVILMGTRNALGQLEKLQDIDWLAEDAKRDKYRTGRIGYFDECATVEVPQAYLKEDAGLKKQIPDDFILVLPVPTNAFIKTVWYGDIETLEVTEKGATMDDQQTYEVQFKVGVAAVVGQYLGKISLPTTV